MRKKQKPQGKRRQRQISADSFLRAEDISKIQSAIGSTWHSCRHATELMIIDVFLQTGLRSQELADLELRDLPHKRGRQSLFVRHGKGNVERTVDVSDDLAARIEEYCKLFRCRAHPTSPLFKSERGGMLSYSALYSRVRKFGLKNGIPYLRPHKLRHTYATWLYNLTKDIKYVQEQLGHADTRTTQIYVGLLKVDRKVQLRQIYEDR